jgi:hypothetical protein
MPHVDHIQMVMVEPLRLAAMILSHVANLIQVTVMVYAVGKKQHVPSRQAKAIAIVANQKYILVIMDSVFQKITLSNRNCSNLVL